MSTAVISTKGWIVIPADLRRKYSLLPGHRVVVVDYGGLLAIAPAMDDPVAEAKGQLRGKRSLRAALLNERARERRRGR